VAQPFGRVPTRQSAIRQQLVKVLSRSADQHIDRQVATGGNHMSSDMSSSEERHVYELVELLDEGNVVHLSCPTCGKEVARTLPGAEAVSSTGYRVLRDERGVLLQGDFTARHSWSMNLSLGDVGVHLDY
jgi:hypothetical protein